MDLDPVKGISCFFSVQDLLRVKRERHFTSGTENDSIPSNRIYNKKKGTLLRND